MKIKNVEELAANLHDKSKNIIQITNLKPALNCGLFYEKDAWLKSYISVHVAKAEEKKQNMNLTKMF